MDLEKLCLQVCEVARAAGEFIRKERESFSSDRIEVKGLHDFVSDVDKSAEQLIVAQLQQLLPEAGFITEENTIAQTDAPYQWIVDPLDGTTNFIHGLYPCAVSLALMHGQELVLGVVYEIGLNECFYAWKGSKAYLDGKEIHVSNAATLDNCLVGTGFPYHDFGKLDNYFKCLHYVSQHSHGIRRLGTAATDLVYVACGRLDTFFEYSLRPWDVAAGALIVQQAGGRVCDFAGGSNYLYGEELVASNAAVFDEFLALVKKNFSN